jgi:hypothetical protein
VLNDPFILGESIGLTYKSFVLLGCVVASAYFPTAYWLQIAFDPPGSKVAPRVAGEKLLLMRPFEGFLDSNFAAIATDTMFGRFADSADNDSRSDVELYEDDKPLGPAHNGHADVGKLGQGRFSHWRYNYSIFLFSSSDNTDPRTNGRNYWAVKRWEP